MFLDDLDMKHFEGIWNCTPAGFHQPPWPLPRA